MASIVEKLGTGEALVTVRQGGTGRRIIDPDLSETLRTAYGLWRRLKTLEAALSGAKEKIARRAGELSAQGSTVTFETGGMTCTVTLRHEALVPEENLPELKRLLGRRFRDLVRTRTRHAATSRLVSEAEEEVLGLLRIRPLSPQFKWGSQGMPDAYPETPGTRGRQR